MDVASGGQLIDKSVSYCFRICLATICRPLFNGRIGSS